MLLMLLGALGGLVVIGIIYAYIINGIVKSETKEDRIFRISVLIILTIIIVISLINANLARVIIGIIVFGLGILGLTLVFKSEDKEDRLEDILFSLGAIGFGIFELSHIVYLI